MTGEAPRYVADLKEKERLAHVEQTHSLWGTGTSLPDRAAALERRMAWAGARFRMSGFVGSDGRLLASCKRYSYDLRVRGQILPCLGFGAVFTEPSARKTGLAARLIERVIEESEREGARCWFLFSDIEPRYYERLGFRTLPYSNWELPLGAPARSKLRFRQATAADEPKLLRWYSESVRAFDLAVERDPLYWRLFRQINQAGPDLVLLDGTSEIGFATCTATEKGYLWVEEWAAPAELEPEVWSALGEHARALGLSGLRGWMQPNYRKLTGAVRLERPEEIPMIRLPGDSAALAALTEVYMASVDHY